MFKILIPLRFLKTTMIIPQISTHRLILRAFCESDLDAYAQMCADQEVMRYIGNGKPLSRPEAWRNMAMMVGHWNLRGYGMWAVEERSSNEMIGRVGCWQPEGWPGLEIGWALRREYWGCGYATEAGQAAIDYGFEKLRQSRLISLIYAENKVSRRVAEKLGETLEDATGYASQKVKAILGDEVLLYSITREDWQTKMIHKNLI